MVPMATARSVGNGVITMSLNSTYRRVVRNKAAGGGGAAARGSAWARECET